MHDLENIIWLVIFGFSKVLSRRYFGRGVSTQQCIVVSITSNIWKQILAFYFLCLMPGSTSYLQLLSDTGVLEWKEIAFIKEPINGFRQSLFAGYRAVCHLKISFHESK